ncbi:MAG: AMP-binding protein [Burkholderiaceae bacterium]
MSALNTPCTPVPTPVDRTLDAQLARLARERPDHCALWWRDTEAASAGTADFTYRQLHTLSRAAATRLRTLHGVQRGDRVAWLGLSHPAQLVCLFALAELGATLVPLNHRLSAVEWQSVLADCTPALLIHDTHWRDAARALAQQTGTPCVSAEGFTEAPAPAPQTTATPEDLWHQPLLLVYTSGTTGLPKAAVHTQGNLLSNMAIAARTQGLTANDTVLTILPLFHVGGLCIQTLPTLSVGGTVLLLSRFEAKATLDAIEQRRPTLTLQVPATLKALYELPDWPSADVSSLRAVWAGSSVLPPAALEGFHQRHIPVCNVYGSTETGPFSIALPPDHAHSHAGSCGWPAPGVEVKLCDPHGAEVPTGRVGELCIRAPNVAQRYWPDQPVVDAQGYFHSGDLARQADDGSFTVVGRSKDMIISGGENIYPAEIENALILHPLVSECAVVAQPDPRWGEVAVAVVVLAPGTHEGDGWADPLQAHLATRLARYKQPRKWVAVPGLPKTALGKVQKAALKALLSSDPPQASPV